MGRLAAVALYRSGIEAYVGVGPAGTAPLAHARKGSNRTQRGIVPENLSGRWESTSEFAIASTQTPFSGGMYESSRMGRGSITLD